MMCMDNDRKDPEGKQETLLYFLDWWNYGEAGLRAFGFVLFLVVLPVVTLRVETGTTWYSHETFFCVRL